MIWLMTLGKGNESYAYVVAVFMVECECFYADFLLLDLTCVHAWRH